MIIRDMRNTVMHYEFFTKSLFIVFYSVYMSHKEIIYEIEKKFSIHLL